MKLAKIQAILFLLLGIILCLLGFACGVMSEKSKGVHAQTGAIVNGELILDSEDLWAGYNSEGVRRFKDYSFYAYAFGVACFMGSILEWIIYIRKKRQPIIRKIGKVIEARGNIITIEFQDGTRKRMVAESGVVMIQGDIGEISYQSNRITGFIAR